jgi:predicted phosphoribosyltransferase
MNSSAWPPRNPFHGIGCFYDDVTQARDEDVLAWVTQAEPHRS